MANKDWRQVYQQECRRPGYVIENGKCIEKVAARIRAVLRGRTALSVQSKAA